MGQSPTDIQQHRPARIMIIGQPGSGKSTLAAKLGRLTGLPVFHIDKEVHWLPDWQERNREEKTKLCLEIHRKKRWIFEGGHSSTWDDRLNHADMLVWLDIPLSVRYWRVIKRTLIHYGQSRPDLPERCPERFSWEFLHFIWRTRHKARSACETLFMKAEGNTRRICLSNQNEIDDFIAQIKLEFIV